MQKFYQGITDFIFVEHELQKADIIFLPGGDYPESAYHAAELYRQGLAPLILPSGKYSILKGQFDGPFATEWEYLRSILIQQGVLPQHILKEDQASFTYENAIRSRQVLEAEGIRPKRAILSCQAFHARRCLMYYQEQFPDTQLLVSPVVTKGISRENWFLEKEKIEVVLGEVERCGAQFHEIMNANIWKELNEKND